jgi:hypothetical protein
LPALEDDGGEVVKQERWTPSNLPQTQTNKMIYRPIQKHKTATATNSTRLQAFQEQGRKHQILITKKKGLVTVKSLTLS